jgi:hypothetical protein
MVLSAAKCSLWRRCITVVHNSVAATSSACANSSVSACCLVHKSLMWYCRIVEALCLVNVMRHCSTSTSTTYNLHIDYSLYADCIHTLCTLRVMHACTHYIVYCYCTGASLAMAYELLQPLMVGIWSNADQLNKRQAAVFVGHFIHSGPEATELVKSFITHLKVCKCKCIYTHTRIHCAAAVRASC